MKFIPTIGLEVHVQLKTESKIFCSCAVEFGAEPNSRVCPVCLGLPGALPVLNSRVVELAIRAALALNCSINPVSVFARKNYFYPDLPKGYQISQFDRPLAEYGSLQIEIEENLHTVGIRRIHLEEDAGKSMHPEGKEGVSNSRIDMNRCGVPLIEIVSEPVISSAREAHEYLVRLKQLLLYLGVSDCSMEEGSLRCDANVSVRPEGSDNLGVRTELKNLNSFRFVEKAIEYEIERQIGLVKNGGEVLQETFSWDAANRRTVLMRSKEESEDYRYFPEPDLPPLVAAEDLVESIRTDLPEMPLARKERFISDFGISVSTAEILTARKETADFFESAAEIASPDKVGNWITGELFSLLKESGSAISEYGVSPEGLAGLVNLVEGGTVSAANAKTVLRKMAESGKSAEDLTESLGMDQISDESRIESEIEKVLEENRDEVLSYLNGKEKLIGFFVGQVMKRTKGKANPGIVNKILKEKLEILKTTS